MDDMSLWSNMRTMSEYVTDSCDRAMWRRAGFHAATSMVVVPEL
jgi:hypothetical protein